MAATARWLLCQGLVHPFYALINRYDHHQEGGNKNNCNLARLTNAKESHQKEYVSQRGDIADKLDPGLHHMAERIIPP